MASFFAKYKKWQIPSKLTFWSLVISLIGVPAGVSFFFGDPATKIAKSAFESQVRPNIHLTNVEVTELKGCGTTVLGTFTNGRDSVTHDFRWAVFGRDGKTSMPFLYSPFGKAAPPALGPFETEKLPLFAIKDLANLVPVQYAGMTFRGAYMIPPPLEQRPEGIYVPVVASFSCQSDAEANRWEYAFVCSSDRKLTH